jgi:pyruvate formate lyase activating enzyme
MSEGMIFDIKRYAIHDGPGIRTAVFFKGCPLDCWWCHNPEGKSVQSQLIFRKNRCHADKACLEACPRKAITWDDGSITDWANCDACGECAQVCYAGAREMVGQSMTIGQLMTEIERDIPFYDQSGGGVTFTGGEPLYQRKFLEQALLACKEKHIHTAVDTSGYASWAGLKKLISLVDLFLYDIKLMDEEKHIRYTSVSNKLILTNLQKLSAAEANIIVRIPLIPQINDDEHNITLCAAYLADLPHLEGVTLMPYHDIGEAKYQALGQAYRLPGTKPPSNEQITETESILSSYRIPLIDNSGRVA